VKNKAATPADSTSAACCNSQGFRHAPVAALEQKEYIDCQNAYKGRDVSCWHIASFRCDAEFVRHRGIADINENAPI
jgi:hypothetical protein